MASFYAELQVAGNTYRVVHCYYACHQATDARGRVQAKVRYAPLELVLDVPTDDGLLAWAHAPHKPLAGQVVFYDVARQTAHETIAFSAGECVQYAEDFASSATGDGAYVCQLTITAPSFELRAGGPAGAAATAGAVAAAVQSVVNKAPQVAEVAPNPAFLVRESNSYSLADATTHFVRPAAPFDWELAQQLDQTFPISLNTPPGFAEAARADLQALYNTPTGKRLITSIQASGKKIPIGYGEVSGARFPHFPDDPYRQREPNWEPAFYQEDGSGPGAGVAMEVMYDPFREKSADSSPEWHKRPPGIGLAHELVHAEQAAYGRMLRGNSPNPGGFNPNSPDKPMLVHTYELETVGVPPYDSYPVSENKIRAEWNPPQPTRRHY
jgi:hypothetical protein